MELFAKKPKFVVKFICVPCAAGLPVLSVNTAVIVEKDTPSALTVVGFAVKVSVDPPWLSFNPDEDPPHPLQEIKAMRTNRTALADNNERFIKLLIWKTAILDFRI
jgi:hypothetical protein